MPATNEQNKPGDYVRATTCTAMMEPLKESIRDMRADIRRVHERINKLIMAVTGTGLAVAGGTAVLLLKGCGGG